MTELNSNELISKEKIRQHAIEAADRGDEPTVCKYVPDTESWELWRDAYFGRINALSVESAS